MASATGSASSASTCPPARLRVALGAVSGSTQKTMVVDLTNTGPATCNISVAAIVITPPGAFTQARLAWKQPVLPQDAATRPRTSISPVEPGR